MQKVLKQPCFIQKFILCEKLNYDFRPKCRFFHFSRYIITCKGNKGRSGYSGQKVTKNEQSIWFIIRYKVITRGDFQQTLRKINLSYNWIRVKELNISPLIVSCFQYCVNKCNNLVTNFCLRNQVDMYNKNGINCRNDRVSENFLCIIKIK